MIGVLGHDSALLRLYWAGDNLSEWDEFVVSLLYYTMRGFLGILKVVNVNRIF